MQVPVCQALNSFPVDNRQKWAPDSWSKDGRDWRRKNLYWWRSSGEIGRAFLIGPYSSGEIYNRVITNWETPNIDRYSATSSVRDFLRLFLISLPKPFLCIEIWGKCWKRDWSNLRCLSPSEQLNKNNKQVTHSNTNPRSGQYLTHAQCSSVWLAFIVVRI